MKTADLPSYEDCVYADDAGCFDALMDFIRLNEPNEKDKSEKFRQQLADMLTDAESNIAEKILQRLSVIFTDYKNAGFENSAQVTKYIMNEIEALVK